MKSAKEFRKRALEVLKGKWGLAAAAAILASILGASSAANISVGFNISLPNSSSGSSSALI